MLNILREILLLTPCSCNIFTKPHVLGDERT